MDLDEQVDQDLSLVEHVLDTIGSAIAGHGRSCNIAHSVFLL